MTTETESSTSVKEYLGDSVYADFDGFHIVLTTENSNTIAIDGEVFAALIRFQKRMIERESPFLPPGTSHAFVETCDRAKGYMQDAEKNVDKIKGQVASIMFRLSPSCDFNPFGGTAWFTVDKREDVTVIMELAPIWTKGTHDTGICYSAEIDGVPYRIIAKDDALPPTCRLVERVVEVPAQPARMEKKMVVECSHAEKPSEEIPV